MVIMVYGKDAADGDNGEGGKADDDDDCDGDGDGEMGTYCAPARVSIGKCSGVRSEGERIS